jgi:hypothetical protein
MLLNVTEPEHSQKPERARSFKWKGDAELGALFGVAGEEIGLAAKRFLSSN